MKQEDSGIQKVTVLGQGAIGGAVARRLLEAGIRVTVWNRTQAKSESAADVGASVAPTAAEAIAASPLIISCLWDYSTTDKVLAQQGAAEALAGKDFVQLSTGSSDEAERQAAWASDRGASFLAGGVMCFPRAIGAQDTIVLYAGDPSSFEKNRDVLALIAPAQQHLGDSPGIVAPTYLALWTFYFSGIGGFIDGLALLAAHDLSPQSARSLIMPMATKLVDGASDLLGRLDSRDFSGSQTTVASMREGLGDVLAEIRLGGLDPIMLRAYVERLGIAAAAGRGDEDVAAVADLLTSSGLRRKADQ